MRTENKPLIEKERSRNKVGDDCAVCYYLSDLIMAIKRIEDKIEQYRFCSFISEKRADGLMVEIKEAFGENLE